MHARLTSTALVLAFLLFAARPAAADAAANAYTGTDGIDHSARNDAVSSGSNGGSGAASECTYRRIEITGEAPVFNDDGTPVDAPDGGAWYERWCGDTNFAGVFYISPVDPAELAAEARKYLSLPVPDPRLSPASDQVVNLPTWLWIDPAGWTERTSTVSVPGVSVTVVARPDSTVWNLGDGTVVTCNGPGTSYDPTVPESAQASTCSHTYSRSSADRPGHAFQAGVTVRWRASWTAAGAPGGGDLGFIDRSTTFPVRVGEVQALNITAARQRPPS